MRVHSSDLKRRFALFDEVSELPPNERPAWLSALQTREPEHAGAVQAMLDELDRSATHPEQSPSLAGLSARAFEAQVDEVVAPDASATVQAGDGVGPWQLERKIGEGGMGAVWLAARRDGHFDGLAAIKFLRTGLGKTDLVERFLRERRLLARLTHPGIARLLDAGAHQGEPYLVMEYIDGQPINQWACAHAPRVADRVALLLKVCRATEYAHSQLVVHRDIKPSNVVVGATGEPSLLDFGIAKLIDDADAQGISTALTHLTGRGFTLGYCAPEQITGEPAGVAADVFSLGVVLYELLAGVLPFAGEGRAALEHAIVHTTAPTLGKALATPNPAQPADAALVRGDLEAIVAKALRKNPSDRYPSVGALAADLERWLQHLPVHARRGNWRYTSGLWLRRNRAVAAVTAVAFVAVGAGLVAALSQAQRANLAAQYAEQQRLSAQDARTRAENAAAQTTLALARSEEAKAAETRARVDAVGSAARAETSGKLAVQEATKAKAVSQFLVTLFESADPERTRGEKLLVRDVLDAGAKKLSQEFAHDASTLVELQGVLGRTYGSLSQPQRAVELLSQAAAASAKHKGVQSLEYARLALALAHAEMDAEKFPDAERHFREALPAISRADGPMSDTVILGRSHLAYVLQKQGKHAETDAILTPLRAEVIAARGTTGWMYVEVENSRAVSAGAQGNFAKELEILLGIEPLLAQPPPGKMTDALTIRGNVAVSLARAGKFEQAMPRLQRVGEDQATHLGPDAERTLQIRYFLGEISRQMGQYRACASLYDLLAQARQRTSGNQHVQTVDAMARAALCHQFAGEPAQAAAWLEKARQGLPASDTPPQRTVLRTLGILALLELDTQGQAQQALARGQALVDALKLPAGTPEAFLLAVSIANADLQAGNLPQALQRMEALSTSPSYARLYMPRALHAYVLALAGQSERAQSLVDQARSTLVARFPGGHPAGATLDYVQALATPQADANAALAQLTRAAGRTPRLPLSPGWLGF
ncbi:MAG: serine/threonine-protein kinase [Pseudomonadota bacterium]